MIELTLDRTKELLAEAVAERGEDYVYSDPDGQVPGEVESVTCLYVHCRNVSGPLDEAVPGCIVGWVLHKAGVPLYDLRACEHEDASGAVARLEASLKAGEDGIRLLLAVQRRQDAGQPWGQALANALAEEESRAS